jgi:hypothetical protein
MSDGLWFKPHEMLKSDVCEDLYGHVWTDDDRCQFCGKSWNELYEIVTESHPDGSDRVSVRRKGQPEFTGTVHLTLPAIRWDDSTQPVGAEPLLTIQVYPDA